MGKRIIIKKQTERKTSCATRTYARELSLREQRRVAKLGKVGMFDFHFTLIRDRQTINQSSEIIKEARIKTDSYDEAVEYARINTPPGHQGMIDGLSVVYK